MHEIEKNDFDSPEFDVTGNAIAVEALKPYSSVPYLARLEVIRGSEEWLRANENLQDETQYTLGLRAYEFVNNNPGSIIQLRKGTVEEQLAVHDDIDFELSDGTVITTFAFESVEVAEGQIIPAKLALFIQNKGDGTLFDSITDLSPTDSVININPLDAEFGVPHLHSTMVSEGRRVIFPTLKHQETSEILRKSIENHLRKSSRWFLYNLNSSARFLDK